MTRKSHDSSPTSFDTAPMEFGRVQPYISPQNARLVGHEAVSAALTNSSEVSQALDALRADHEPAFAALRAEYAQAGGQSDAPTAEAHPSASGHMVAARHETVTALPKAPLQ